MLLKLADRKDAARVVAKSVADNKDAAGEVARAVANNFDKLPEEVKRKLLGK